MPDFNDKGLLFENGFKKEDKHPDMTGKCTIDGKPYKLAAWWNYRAGKPPFLNLSFTMDTEIDNTPPPEPENMDEIDDDLPF